MSWARLLREKCGEAECFSGTEAMQRGHELEPKARARFQAKVGIKVHPACLQSNEHEWLQCSVDGLSHDGSRVLEIKCGHGIYHRVSQAKSFPRDLFAQLQHILAVTDLPVIDLFCYWPGLKDIHLEVARDDAWIKGLMSAEHDFWLQVCRRRR
jgi:putative phage-type endonuclease